MNTNHDADKTDTSEAPPNRVASSTQEGQVDDTTLLDRGKTERLPEDGGEAGHRIPVSEPEGDLAKVVAETMAKVGEVEAPPLPSPAAETAPLFEDPIPSRMLNEFVYCQRLFYYEFVEGVFLHNADTRKGLSVHSRVDRAKGGTLPTKQAGRKAKSADSRGKGGKKSTGDDDIEELPEVIHSRSVSLGSDALGVTAKLDLVEVRKVEDELFSEMIVCPVEYKVGSPKEDEEGFPTLWDTDKIQLGLQILLLRENGYDCEEGVLFYRGTRQRVRLPMTEELENWIRETILEARRVAVAEKIPAPLLDSPKCVRCSLAPVCLPDETQLLIDGPESKKADQSGNPRRLIASRDVKRVVYLTTPGMQVGISKSVLRFSEKGKLKEEVPINDVLHLGLFGNVGITTPTMREMMRREIPVSWFSTGGWFYGMARGHGLKNVMVRIDQFAAASDEARCLELARHFVRGKIRNARVLLMRNHGEPPPPAIKRLKRAGDHDAMAAGSLSELLGIEGAAASVYFSHFSGMLKAQGAGGNDEGENGSNSSESAKTKSAEAATGPVKVSEPTDEVFTFNFNGRNRRPPRDAVNALLSLAYSLLAKDCAVAAHAVGFDPYVGFYHQPRHGRPALALDLMEEFRPLVADSAVLQAINNRVVTPKDFVRSGEAVNLTPAGRKRFLQVWERRMGTTVTHPVFKYQVSYRRALELQFRMLARVLTGEIEEYVPFLTR